MGNKASVPTAAAAPGAPAATPITSTNSVPKGLFAANSAASAPLPPVVQAANKKLVTLNNNAARANAALAAQQATVGELNAKYNLVEPMQPMQPMQGGRKSRKNRKSRKSRKNRKSRKGKSRKNL
jgi:hypothetical protein